MAAEEVMLGDWVVAPSHQASVEALFERARRRRADAGGSPPS